MIFSHETWLDFPQLFFVRHYQRLNHHQITIEIVMKCCFSSHFLSQKNVESPPKKDAACCAKRFAKRFARNVDLTDPDGWMECSENGDTATVSDAPGRPNRWGKFHGGCQQSWLPSGYVKIAIENGHL